MIFCPHCQAVNDDRKTSCVRCGGSLLDDPGLVGDPYVGRQLGRRFTLQHIVGSGEIGMVYKGIDAKTGQAVAVKIVHGDVAEIHGDELLRWARRVAQIRHAKVATVLGASREPDGTTYMVSEFIEGETLRGLIERVGPLSARRAADILFQLCNALAPIHKVSRPHANLKPENVFLVAGQKGDFIKVTDTGSPVLFGVHQSDRGRVVIGAPKYFSPEQASGAEVGLASDQFTVGVIGYQLLSGALPFFGATPDQLLEAVRHNQPTPITERAANIPPALAAVIERCMAKNPAARFPDLRALAREIARVIKSNPQAAPRKKKPFGAGLDMSTVVARPDDIPDLNQFAPLGASAGFSAADAEATVMQEVPEDIQALLDEATPSPVAAPTPPAISPMDELDLSFDDAFGEELDLNAALADAAASVEPEAAPPERPVPGAGIRDRGTAPRVSGPGRLDVGDLAAVMAEAEAELDAQAGGPAPAFDPFGDMAQEKPARSKPPAPARIASTPPGGRAGAPIAQRASVSQPLRPDDILNAIGEELDPGPARVSQTSDAASPLATAADFARLSVPPRDVKSISGPSTLTGPVVSANRGAGSRTGLLVLLLVLLLAGGGAAVWFLVLAPPDPPPERPRPTAGKSEKPKPKPAAPAAALAAELVTDPAGAEVFEGETKLGQTPLELPVGEAPRELVLKVEGRPDTPFTLDPKAVDPEAAPEGGGPVRVEVPLAEAADGGAGDQKAGEPGDQKAAGKPRDQKAGDDKAGGSKTPPKRRRTRRRSKTPDPNDIRDPFANP